MFSVIVDAEPAEVPLRSKDYAHTVMPLANVALINTERFFTPLRYVQNDRGDVNNEYHIRLLNSYKKTTASDGLSDVLLKK
ncbi:hypothetical protein [Flavobacterium sp. B17]|uniref:hypothetical protein n=1 Tax=Flavobacterium sp. B17 TaxID=95618 RepID=UPI0005B2DBBC|nr:hypothetical protein [Flavobacterium sp. B17]